MSRTLSVGVDVGGSSKGFHAVVLDGLEIVEAVRLADVRKAVEWCISVGADAIGVDASCRWSATGRARRAERELRKERIFCFSTPTEEIARLHPKDYFGWMRNGFSFYQGLRDKYQSFHPDRLERPIVFETFPHAIVCGLVGKVVAAKPKSKVRRGALAGCGISTSKLPNIDLVDAALCALTARDLIAGRFQCYGDEEEGFLVVPVPARDVPAAI